MIECCAWYSGHFFFPFVPRNCFFTGTETRIACFSRIVFIQGLTVIIWELNSLKITFRPSMSEFLHMCCYELPVFIMVLHDCTFSARQAFYYTHLMIRFIFFESWSFSFFALQHLSSKHLVLRSCFFFSVFSIGTG